MEQAMLTKMVHSTNDLTDVVSRLLGRQIFMRIETKTDRHGVAKAYATSATISGDSLGLAQFIIKNVEVGSFGSIWEGDGEIGPAFELHFGYDMQDSGSNGASVAIGGKRIMLTFDAATGRWSVNLK